MWPAPASQRQLMQVAFASNRSVERIHLNTPIDIQVRACATGVRHALIACDLSTFTARSSLVAALDCV